MALARLLSLREGHVAGSLLQDLPSSVLNCGLMAGCMRVSNEDAIFAASLGSPTQRCHIQSAGALEFPCKLGTKKMGWSPGSLPLQRAWHMLGRRSSVVRKKVVS